MSPPKLRRGIYLCARTPVLRTHRAVPAVLLLLLWAPPYSGSPPAVPLAQPAPAVAVANAPTPVAPADVDRGLKLMETGLEDQAMTALVASLPAHRSDAWGGRIQFVLGFLCVQNKRYTQALVHLRDPLILKSGVEDISVFYQGQAYYSLKDYARAAEAFQWYAAARPESALVTEAVKLQGESLAQIQRYPEAAAAFLRALRSMTGWELPSVHFKAAECLQKADVLQDSLTWYEKLYSEYPGYYRDKEVEARIRSLRASLHLPTAIPPETIEKRAASFARVGSYRSAANEYVRLKTAYPSYFASKNLSIELGVAAYKGGNQALARSLLAEAAPGDMTGRANLTLAEMAREAGKDNKALYAAASRANSSYAEYALYRLFTQALSEGDDGLAGVHMEELVRRFPGYYAGSALWKRAWALYAARSFSDAADLFLRYDAACPLGDYAAASLYWSARAAAECGRTADAQSRYQAVLARFPRTIYAYLASDAIGRPVPSFAPARVDVAAQRAAYFASFRAALAPAVQAVWDRVELLRLCRLNSLATRELGALRQRAMDPTPYLVRQATIYHDIGQHRQAIVTLRDAFPTYLSMSPEELPRFIWEMFYPLEYVESFEEQAARLGIRRNLLLGLACQESCFHPRARSPSGAVGIMQLLPSTARYVARRYRLSYSYTGLLDPERNIQMGALYLQGLLKQFGNNEVYALIGYNAGPGRVTSWSRTMPSLDGLEIAENALFAETRNYALVVLQNAREYERLYGK
ncbi:MAG: transglycosylase SLT domain-containing protein [Acidobacteriota bacterium]